MNLSEIPTPRTDAFFWCLKTQAESLVFARQLERESAAWRMVAEKFRALLDLPEISAGIKGLAKELSIPIIVLCQLNRESDKRGGTRAGEPKLSDLRESGAIEQDADFVGMMYRPSYYGVTAYPEAYAELILTKNRHGETGIVPLEFNRQFTQFSEGKRFIPSKADASPVDW